MITTTQFRKELKKIMPGYKWTVHQAHDKLGGKCLKLVAIGKDRGIPDRELVLPNGIHIYVELKAPGKVPSKQQAHRQKELTDLGHTVHVIDCMSSVNTLMSDIKYDLSFKSRKGL